MNDVDPAITGRCTVLICDDRPEYRDAIGQFSSDAARFRVVGESVDGVS